MYSVGDYSLLKTRKRRKTEMPQIVFKHYSIFIFVFLVFSVSRLFIGCTKIPTASTQPRPQVKVQSPIAQNTTWTSGNDYIVRGQVTVEENALLTIQPDVNVFLTADSVNI